MHVLNTVAILLFVLYLYIEFFRTIVYQLAFTLLVAIVGGIAYLKAKRHYTTANPEYKSLFVFIYSYPVFLCCIAIYNSYQIEFGPLDHTVKITTKNGTANSGGNVIYRDMGYAGGHYFLYKMGIGSVVVVKDSNDLVIERIPIHPN